MNVVFMGINFIIAIVITCMLSILTDNTRNHDPRQLFNYVVDIAGIMFVIVLWVLFNTTYILAIK